MLKNETLFFELALKSDALLLGDFILKSGKKSLKKTSEKKV